MGVSGPSEFAELPPADRKFWNEWFDEALERVDDEQPHPFMT